MHGPGMRVLRMSITARTALPWSLTLPTGGVER